MKRLPLIMSFVAVVLLSVSLAYWAMQLFKPPQRPLAAAPQETMAEPSLEAAASLFGGQPVTVAVSNYQLRGVVAAVAGKGGVAILGQEGKPTQALVLGAEVAPGVKVKEVQPGFVLLDEGGVVKRVDLMVEAAKPGGPDANVGVTRTPIPMPAQVQPPTPVLPPVAVPVPTPSMAPGMTAQDIQLQQLQQQQQQLLQQQQMLQQQLQQMPPQQLPTSRTGATTVSPPPQR